MCHTPRAFISITEFVCTSHFYLRNAISGSYRPELKTRATSISVYALYATKHRRFGVSSQHTLLSVAVEQFSQGYSNAEPRVYEITATQGRS